MSGDYRESVKEIKERLISEREILKAAEMRQREEFIPAQEKADALWHAVKHNVYCAIRFFWTADPVTTGH